MRKVSVKVCVVLISHSFVRLTVGKYCYSMKDFVSTLHTGLSSLSAVEKGMQHVLADIMSKDINIINATRQWSVLLFHFGCTLFPKLAITLASNTHNSVCSSWISTKHQILQLVTIICHHTYYDRAVPCVLSVTSACQSLLTLTRQSMVHPAKSLCRGQMWPS